MLLVWLLVPVLSASALDANDLGQKFQAPPADPCAPGAPPPPPGVSDPCKPVAAPPAPVPPVPVPAADPCAPSVASPNPCGTTTPWIPLPPIPVTPAPLPSPVLIAPTPAPPPPVKVQTVCLDDLTNIIRPGAFTPWSVYKFLKVNAPYIDTEEKEIAGGQTMKILNAGVQVFSSSFTCVAEANEWKARVRDPRMNIFTMELENGFGRTRICLLQDISLYRSVEGMPALRLDYGNCPNALNAQAFVMVGLKKVANGVAHPNVKGFFEDVCVTNPRTSPGIALDLQRAGSTATNCFATSVDMEYFSSLDGKCFPEGMAFQMLNSLNGAPVLPVPEMDWAWIEAQLPVGAHPADDACATTNPKQMFGKVIMDRVCLQFQGLQAGCQNQCGSSCGSVSPQNVNTTTTFAVLPSVSKECPLCDWQEVVYAILGTLIAGFMSYYATLAIAQKMVLTWQYQELPGFTDTDTENIFAPTVKADTNVFNSSIVVDKDDGWSTYKRACCAIAVLTLVFSFMAYYLLNVFETIFILLINAIWNLVSPGNGNLKQCIRLLPFQHDIWSDQTGRGLLWSGECYGRMLDMIIVTWISLFLSLCYWRYNLRRKFRQVILTEKIITEEEGMGVTEAEGQWGEVRGPAVANWYTTFMKYVVP